MPIERSVGVLLGVLSSCRQAALRRNDLSDADWDEFARTAVRLGVAPMVHACLRAPAGAAHVDEHVPDRVRELLKSHYIRTTLDNLRLYGRLAPLLRAAAEESIDVVVLKGAFLAEAVYRDRGRRPMGDADLLVRRADLPRFDRILRAQGWQQHVADDPLAPSLVGGHQLQTFTHGSARVEAHWNIEDDDSPFAIDMDGVWQRARTVRIAGVAVLGLAPEDLLLHLCLHTSYNHGWLQFEAGLRPLVDIAVILRHGAGDFDWTAFAARAVQWKVQHCVMLTLTLVSCLLGDDIPEHVLVALAPDRPDRAVIDAAIRLVLGTHYRDVLRYLPALGPRWLVKRRRNLGPHQRMRRLLWPDADALRAAYPSLRGLPLACHPLHWFDLSHDALRVLLRPEGRRLWSCERRRMILAGWLEAPGAPQRTA